MLQSQLANTPIVQLPDPDKSYLLFTDIPLLRCAYSSTHKDSDEALVKIITSKDPLYSVASQTRDLQLDSPVVHPVAYISGSFSKGHYKWSAIMKECFSIFMSIKKCAFYLQNTNLLVHSDHKPLLNIFTGHTNNEKCNTWGLEAAAIPRYV